MRSLLLAFMTLVLAGCDPTDSSASFPEPESLPSLQLAEPEETSIPFGQPVDLTVRITTEEPLGSLNPEAWLDPAITLLDSDVEEQELEGGWQKDISLTVALYAVTNTPVFVSTPLLETPGLTLPFVALETTSRLEADQPLPTFGTGVPPDFRGPEALRRRKRNLWIGAGVLTLLALVLGLVLRALSKRERPLPPLPPAHVLALRKLEALRTRDIWMQKDLEASTVELSLILRSYIEDRFGIQAPDLTTEEFLLQVEASPPWPRQQQAGLTEFFTAADLIKYAGDRPSGDILDALYAAVEQFVNATREPEA